MKRHSYQRSESYETALTPELETQSCLPPNVSDGHSPFHEKNGFFETSNDQNNSMGFLQSGNGDRMEPDDISRQAFDKQLSPSDLIEWLFHDDHSNADVSNGRGRSFSTSSGPRIDYINGVSPLSLLESIFAVLPDFPSSKNRKCVDITVRQNLVQLIPSLEQNPDFVIPKIERCLQIYWLLFHPQYPILHRPSFSNFDAHPILLLAMVMVGANLSQATGVQENFQDAKALADQIAEPLRWLVFANQDCRPPAKVWVVQSLILLETYEITSTSRVLHERAYLHHGSKIQLLRRSPILGGDPLKGENEDVTSLPPNHVWNKWIEVELMKRATLAAFYLDTVHATVYGHMIVLYAHQIRMSLPCADELWEFDNESQKSDLLTLDGTTKFLSGLKLLLNKQKVNTSAFGRKVLLAGLLTIMFQMQQKDLQLLFLEWNSMKESWKNTISLAIDVWRVDLCSDGGCCDVNTTLCLHSEDIKFLPPMLRLNDKRCKLALYHIAQIYMRITHYDYIIYAGAPGRMNVKAGASEYHIVELRVKNWAHSANGRVSVIHAYLFLCEMLLSHDNDDITYSYNPNSDPFLYRRNIMVSAVLVVFGFNFALYGPELLLFGAHSVADELYPEREEGYEYLRRMRRELSSCDAGPFHKLDYGSDSSKFHRSIGMYGERLLQIPNSNHIVGLLKIFYRSYRNCNWEIGREYSNLLKNCIERCLGRPKVVCENMYVT